MTAPQPGPRLTNNGWLKDRFDGAVMVPKW
jgi:hypothetical protein